LPETALPGDSFRAMSAAAGLSLGVEARRRALQKAIFLSACATRDQLLNMTAPGLLQERRF
jgi:hypothetical protein